MTTWTFAQIEATADGFLTRLTQEDCRMTGAVLLSACYQSDLVSDALFEALGIPCPDNIARAAPKRKADFLAGRTIATAAMTRLSRVAAPIGTAASRAPIWPAGVTGSISHARGRCACLVSLDVTRSYGIDTEAIAQGTALRAILSETLSATDRAQIAQAPLSEDIAATLAFSGKEALFKALFPRVGRHFGFSVAHLTAPPTSERLTFALTTDLRPELRQGRAFTLDAQVTETHVQTWLAT